MSGRDDERFERVRARAGAFAPAVLATLLVAACFMVPDAPRNGWRSDLGPVIPHDTFPTECSLCHESGKWQVLKDDFTFDHEAETGFALEGAHQAARCLRCHNDRGPVEQFQAKGCVGCHDDIHQGQLGRNCQECHNEWNWVASGMREMHARTRFPLMGIHAQTSCHRCHPGAAVGRFTHTDTECVTCHRVDLANANNPPHLNLGLVDRCDRCHIPTSWNVAEVGN